MNGDEVEPPLQYNVWELSLQEGTSLAPLRYRHVGWWGGNTPRRKDLVMVKDEEVSARAKPGQFQLLSHLLNGQCEATANAGATLK